MTVDREKRKLAAILHADAKGYSRLMGEDDSFTVGILTKYRELFSNGVKKYLGRIVNTPGDSILAEFPSVVYALHCAVEIQSRLKIANDSLPVNRRMLFRMGVSLGDVIQKGEDIFGDGVNIAARIEALSEEGGICITGPVFDQVKKKFTNLGFENIGAHSVKNISDPIRVYRVLVDPADAGKVYRSEIEKPIRNAQAPTVCIAVMPFDNFSDERERDYFSRGFVEDVITDLSHFPNLQVISSYTASKIGAGAGNELEAARELDIDYLLKGSLRLRGNQVRINTQLLSASNGGILWAERYDAPLETVFDIQDDIVERVVGALSARIDNALLAASRIKPLTSLAAYDCWLRGMEYLREGTSAADDKARRTFNQALEIDPHYSRAYAGMSLSYFNEWSCRLWEQYERTAVNAYDYAVKAVQLDDTDHITHMILGRVLLYRGQFDKAEHHFDKSLALNANDADCLVQLSSCKAFLGKAEEGLRLFLKALRLNPYRNIWYYPYGAFIYFVQRQYDACIETATKGPLTDIWLDLPAYVAAAHAYKGDSQQAARNLDVFKESFQKEITPGRVPETNEILSWVKIANPFKHDDDINHLIEGLVLAGLDDIRSKTDDIPIPYPSENTPARPSSFIKSNNFWMMTFEGSTIQIPEVKGFFDIARLLSRPGTEVHCTELRGGPVASGDPEMVIDEKARRSYEGRIRDLVEDIAEAEQSNDLGRAEKLKMELDQLTDHLSKALGIGNRIRKLGAPAERDRSAVTWRIRSAIRKIECAHPSLGRHLARAIRTGTFCSYSPEKDPNWRL